MKLRLPAAVLAFALLGVACGGAEAGTDASGSASGSTSGSASSTEASAEARVVAHDMGETEVPAEPERVVVLDSPHLDTALSLGVEPIGAVSVFGDRRLPAYLGDRTAGIEVVGSIEEPDLEAIAALQPDLILSATVRHEQVYDQLSQIAPTVFTASSGTNWKKGFALVAQALGKAEEGEAALAEYDERVEALGEQVDASETSAAIVRFLPGETRIYGPDTFSGSVLAEVGFSLPDLSYDEYSMAYISAEQFEQADADVIFTTTYGAPGESTQAEVTGLWGNLPAIQAGCHLAVEDDEWMIGIGLIGANIILDDVEAFLTEHDC